MAGSRNIRQLKLSPPPAGRATAVMLAVSDYIGRSKLKPGEKLPTERELTEALAVGRSTVREVIRQLQTLGVVETRKGSGSYLKRSHSADTIHLPLTLEAGKLRDTLLQTLEIRRGLEVEASALAAKRRTDRDLAIIEAKLDEMERVHLTKGNASPEDLAFHMAIYDATHNPLFRQLLGQMNEGFERFWNKPFDRPDFASRSVPLHRQLFNAIRDGDPKRAASRTLAILAIVEGDILSMSK